MTTYKSHIIRALISFIFIIVLSITFLKLIKKNSEPYKLGGYLHKIEKQNIKTNLSKPVIKINEYDLKWERFIRPSKKDSLELKYYYKGFKGLYKDLEPPYIPKGYPQRYNKPLDIIHAYYSLLKYSANMVGYQGGCGTIGQSRHPYPFAYELLSGDTKEKVTLEEFEKSFSGTGHITLLKLYPAYHPLNTPKNIKYYMVELETITGAPYSKDEEYKAKPTYFSYYYGIITTVFDKKEGWKIKSVDYIPEDFLCAPSHGWDWEGELFVHFVYHDWYKLIEKIDKVERKDSLISIYASGKDEEYRFDFVRLTNGVDILLHEYIKENDVWKEVNILKPDHQNYKLSILNFIK